jgi:D-alanine-D-alanine ligase
MLTKHNPEEFGKVVVLMGGDSAEREISLVSGQTILEALKRQGIDAQGVDVQDDVITQLQTIKPDRAFIALHGPRGEDGSIQAVLDYLGVLYPGSGVAASALAIDKAYSKLIWASVGMPTPDFRIAFEIEAAIDAMEEFGFPLCIKPCSEGSSLGVSKIMFPEQLPAAFDKAAAFGGKVMIEPWIEGEEYTVGILGGETLPPVEIRTPRDFYDFDAKYNADSTQYICPTTLSPEQELELQELALLAFGFLGCKDWGRVDVILRGKEYWLLEVNTIPGMTSHSLLPKAASVLGLSYDELVMLILSTTLTVDLATLS